MNNEKRKEYYKKNGTQMNLWLSYETEGDILQWLDEQDSKRASIIKLIRKEIKNHD